MAKPQDLRIIHLGADVFVLFWDRGSGVYEAPLATATGDEPTARGTVAQLLMNGAVRKYDGRAAAESAKRQLTRQA